MSQIDFTAALSDCGEACFFPDRRAMNKRRFSVGQAINPAGLRLTLRKAPSSCAFERWLYRC